MQQMTAYKASDGTVFVDQTEAEDHERKLNDLAAIEEFIAQSETCGKRGQATRARNIIEEFLEYIQNAPETPELREVPDGGGD